MVRYAALVLALAACSDNTTTIHFVIDGPPAGTPAAAFPDLDTVELGVALAGEPLNLVSKTFRRGEDIELPDVPYGENLVLHMIGRVGNNEVAVGRTCPFAVHAGEDPPTPHLYFARTVNWAEAGEPASGTRDGATALTDFAGNALFIGGVDQTSLPLSGIDRFDTMQGRFEQVAQVQPRRNGTAGKLGDGRIIVVGGVGTDGLPVTNYDLVDLQASQPVNSPAAGFLFGVTGPAMVTTADGHVVAFGGSNQQGVALKQVVDLRPSGAAVEQRLLQRAVLEVPRKQHTATRLGDDLGAPIVIIGGLDANDQPVARAELYKPLIEEMVPTFAPTMVVPRHDHQAIRLPDGSVLVVGGLDKDNKPVRELEVFTFDSGFQLAGTLPDSAGVIDFTATLLPDGSVLLAGGRDDANNPVATAFIVRLDPTDGELDIVTTDPLANARARHQATLLCDGTVMLVGGTLSPRPAERYNPPSTGRR